LVELDRNYHLSLRRVRQLLADAVEKGKSEPLKIFACTPVETGFS
jgi:hypothetical protein